VGHLSTREGEGEHCLARRLGRTGRNKILRRIQTILHLREAEREGERLQIRRFVYHLTTTLQNDTPRESPYRNVSWMFPYCIPSMHIIYSTHSLHSLQIIPKALISSSISVPRPARPLAPLRASPPPALLPPCISVRAWSRLTHARYAHTHTQHNAPPSTRS
jgi:hypothetical protein